MKNFSTFAERSFIVMSLLFFSGGPLALILSGGVSQGDGQEGLKNSSLIQLIYLIIYLVTCLLLIKQWKQVLNLLLKEKFILLLVGVAFISVLWSYDPTITLRRSLALAGTTLLGIYLATRYSLKHQLQLLGWTFGFAIFLSFLFVLVLPEYGIMGGDVHGGIWRGIYPHKNILGRVMALSAFVFLLLAASSQKNRFFLWCGFSFSLILLIFSTSKTALAVCVVLFAILGMYWLWQRCYSLLIPTLISLFMVGGSLFMQVSANFYAPLALSDMLSLTFNAKSIPALSDTQLSPKKSSPEARSQKQSKATVSSEDLRTLTGRKPMWTSLMKMIRRKPWLGYGYNAFWLGSNSPSAEVWLDTKPWKPRNAHNGLLELWADLGLLGVSIFLIEFFISSLKALVWVRQSQNIVDLWMLLYFTYIFLLNLTTNALVEYNSIFWLLYVASVFSMFVRPQSSQIPEKR